MKRGQPFNPYGMFTGVFVPEALVRCPDLSLGAKLAYGRLARYMGKGERCNPSLATLGRELGTSRDSAKRYVQELTAAGLIRAKRRKTKAGDPDTSEVVFLWHVLFETEGVGAEMHLPGRGENAPTVGADLHRGVGAKMPPQESHKEESHLKESAAAAGEWPQTLKALRHYPFPVDAPEEFLTGQILPTVRETRPEVTDGELAAAVPLCIKRKGQQGPGLLPKLLCEYFRNGRAPGVAPSLADEILRAINEADN